MELRSVAALAVAGSLALSGCAQQRLRDQVQAAQAKRQAAVAACRAEVPKEPGNFVRRAECLNRADAEWATDPSTRDGDIAMMVDARRLDLADKVDRGEISPIQYEAQLQAVIAEALSVAQQRTAAEAQRQQAAGLAFMQWNAMQQQQQQQYRPFQFPQAAPVVSPPVNCTTSYSGTMAYTQCH